MFNDRIHSFQEKDSLEDESQRQQFENPFYEKQEDNYEFLYDEEYQSLKQWKDKQLENKWQQMIQNLSNNFLLRETWSDLDYMNQYLQRSQNLQDLLLKEQNYSQFSFREADKANQPQRKRYQMNLNLWELREEIQGQNEKMKQLIDNVIQNDKDILKMLQEERENSDLLRMELETKQAKELQQQQFYSFAKEKDDTDELQQESYIEEVETQLQEARAQLLEKKCTIADKEEENKVLKSELIKMNENLNKLEEEKRELDQLVIKVSQELKFKDTQSQEKLTLPDFNKKDFQNTQQSSFQLTQERDHLLKQIEIMKRELTEQKGKHQSLEMVESDLVYKLQTKETELQKSRTYIQELEENIEVKTDAIEKAKRVIEKLNEDLEHLTSQLVKMEEERDHIRREGKEQQRKISDLSRTLDSQHFQRNSNTANVNEHLKREVEELKIALRQYQQEFELEKRQLTDTVRNLNEQKYQITMEKNKVEIEYKNYKHEMQNKYNSQREKVHEFEEINLQLKKQMKEQENELKERIESSQIQSQSNLLYMQKRVKDLSHEIYRLQNQNPDQKLEQLSYITVLKQEFQKVANEILALKKFIRAESLEKLGLQEKIRQFEDFEITVFASILEWEKKTQEIVNFAKKQESNMEESRVNFLKMRDLVNSKDILIEKYRQQLEDREQQQRIGMGIMKKEIERSHYLMQTDLMEGIKIMDKENEMLSKENYEKSKRFQNFKVEFTQVLEDRDRIQHENLRLIGELEYQKKELNKVDDQFFTFRDRIRVIMKIQEQGEKGHSQIVPKLEHLVEEQFIIREELHHYKALVQELQNQAEQEKQFLQKRVKVVEEQIEHIQKQSLSKEEESQIKFLEKETKYINEIQSLEDKSAQQQNEIQVRERQLKKVQDKLETSQYEVSCMVKEVEKVKAENRELIDRELKTNQEYREIQFQFQRNQDELDRKIEILNSLEKKLDNIEAKCRELKEGNRDKQQQLDQEKGLNISLTEQNQRLQQSNEQMNEKSKILDKENSELYSNLMKTKEELGITEEKLRTAEEDSALYLRQNETLNNAIQDAQEEVQNSQKVINDLSEQIEKAKAKDYQIQELQYQIKGLKANEKIQYEMITELRQRLNPGKSQKETQTSEFGIQEVIFLRDELSKLSSSNQTFVRDTDQLKEIIQRQTSEIERLIEEKRDLENMIEHQNQNIKSMRYTQTAFKENFNASNPQILQSSQKTPNKAPIINSNELYSQILQEKENYINRLENEINDMRKDNEHLRDKLIQHEVGAFDKQHEQSTNLRHGRRSSTTAHNSFYNINSMSHNKGYYVQGSSFKETGGMHNNSMQYHV